MSGREKKTPVNFPPKRPFANPRARNKNNPLVCVEIEVRDLCLVWMITERLVVTGAARQEQRGAPVEVPLHPAAAAAAAALSSRSLRSDAGPSAMMAVAGPAPRSFLAARKPSSRSGSPPPSLPHPPPLI